MQIEYLFLSGPYKVVIWARAFCETAALLHRVCHLTEVWMFACILLGISKIEYKPDAGPGDNLCFKHYNPQEVMIILKITYMYHGPTQANARRYARRSAWLIVCLF